MSCEPSHMTLGLSTGLRAQGPVASPVQGQIAITQYQNIAPVLTNNVNVTVTGDYIAPPRIGAQERKMLDAADSEDRRLEAQWIFERFAMAEPAVASSSK